MPRSVPTDDQASSASPGQLISNRIAELGDWRGETLARVRALVHRVVPDVEETWKWRGVPVFEHAGIMFTGETYQSAVKLTFANGAALPDPTGLFNASLAGNARRAIDIHEGDEISERALGALMLAAAEHNDAKRSAKAAARAAAKATPRAAAETTAKAAVKESAKPAA